MKNYKKITVLFVFTCILAACTSVPPAVEDDYYENVSQLNSIVQFDDVMDKDWFLTERRTGSETIAIDRDRLATDGFAEPFSLRFDAELVSGAGAPNSYRAPYTLGDNQGISIGLIAGTLMAPIFEPDGLKEHEYFALLQDVTRWNLAEGKLELYTGETVLVFTLPE